MPKRGGFLAFFEQAGTTIVELPYQRNVNSNDHPYSLHATLDTLSSSVKAAVGSPRNYIGFVPVPKPVTTKVDPQVCSSSLRLQ
jgi:hypothetical protein